MCQNTPQKQNKQTNKKQKHKAICIYIYIYLYIHNKQQDNNWFGVVLNQGASKTQSTHLNH